MLHNSKTEESKKKLSISYWSKKKCICPICKKKFDREEMLSGGNRMIAGDLTDELHRNFEPSAKYGMVYPLIYKVGACPYCNAAFLWNDFETIEDRNTIESVYKDSDNREKIVNNLFPYFDLKRPRTLLDGAAMYYLALLCYEKADIKHSPTFKRAMISLRLAWLCNDLEKACPHHNYDYAAQVFYRKALFFYQQTLLKETTGEEAIANVGHLGPDIDKNYGYDGSIYLCGFL
ncbi:MAG: DUF2225 domain-containing protein, partial [Treponema sp.]|nr:DUF2225 domain-containing protein [Treponema sp.]